MIFYKFDELNKDGLIGVCESEKEFVGFTQSPKGEEAMKTGNIRMATGEDKTIRVYVKDADLIPVDISGATAYFSIKNLPSDQTPLLRLATNVSGQGEIGVASEGEIIFYLTPDDTKDIIPTQYHFDVQLVQANGKRYEVVRGTITLDQTVWND